VTIANVEEVTKKKQVTEVLVTFSDPVNAAEADQASTYCLATPAKKGPYTAKNAGFIKRKLARCSPATNQVALTPKKPFALTKPVQLLVYGTGKTALFDNYGQPIDGGKNAMALPRRIGATITAVVARDAADVRKSIEPAVVDV